MFKGLFGKRGAVPATKGEELPDLEAPEPKLDLSATFTIVMPISVTIPNFPLETFSERVIREYDIQQSILRKKVRSSIFQPQPNGKLRIYPLVVGEKKQ